MADSRNITATRIRARMKGMGMTQADLAEMIGVTQGAISQIISGATHRSKYLPMIAEALAVNLAWLTGSSDVMIELIGREGTAVPEQAWLEGDRFETPQSDYRPAPPPADTDRLRPRGEVSAPDADQVLIEQVDVRFGMGGTFHDGHVERPKRAFPREWVRTLTPAPMAQLVWAVGTGDSMEPTIRDGDPLLADLGQNRLIEHDAIWICMLGEIGMIKRLRPLPDGTVEVLSDNPSVPPMRAADGELHIIGRVLGRWGRL